MGRRFNLISATIALSIFACDFSFAQGPPQKSSGRSAGLDRHNNQFRSPGERFFQLSPEERQAFRKNAERWLRMNPEQQKLLRERYNLHRQQLKNEAEATLRQSGLRLDQNARDQFEARYLQERRRIERELREQFETKRDQELPQLNERLKKEFQSRQSAPSATSTSTPAVAVTPIR
ncbi:MAG: hypothetical protein DMF46_02470 [Verrucomicrobia bacterium]|nr:MAG: hypothetical protein DMF46_02470 [Verrucomicrobiota bacterium]